MKTVKNRIIAVGFAMAVAFALWAPETTNAADQVKGAEKLMSKPVTTLGDLSAIRPGDMMVMSCPKCKNATVHYVEPTFKATESRDKVKTVHTCPGCNSTITVEGHGKAKKDVVTHVCQTCGSRMPSAVW